MPVHLVDLMEGGGKELLDLLGYCVYSMQPEPLFVYLVREYRLAPSAVRALALGDVFCLADAPARLRANELLPPHDLRLHRSLALLRPPVALATEPTSANASGEPVQVARAPRPRPDPGRNLFDHLVVYLESQSDGPLQQIAQNYDPTLTPIENLPGRKMNASQRHFVDRIWQPRLRPLLVQAGFWRLATVGG